MMGTAMNPALQAILDSLNESSTRSPQPLNAHHESRPAIPGLSFMLDADTPAPSSPIPKVLEQKSRTVTPIPDASGITTWPVALKHVVKHIGSNEAIGVKIRQLVAEQHKHETRWWTGRDTIIRKHKSRGDNQQQAADLLRSMGGIPTTLRPINEGTDKAELEAYDKKVYGEFVKMTASYDRQLRSMGIPFYAIKHELVILEQGEERPNGTGRISRGELKDLQKRMLQHLEDLFLDDA